MGNLSNNVSGLCKGWLDGGTCCMDVGNKNFCRMFVWKLEFWRLLAMDGMILELVLEG
jgi:hypothetical protein